jgi:hypothetical protein
MKGSMAISKRLQDAIAKYGAAQRAYERSCDRGPRSVTEAMHISEKACTALIEAIEDEKKHAAAEAVEACTVELLARSRKVARS